MSLTLAQLMSPPSQAFPLGGVRQGSGVYISPEGYISATGATGGFPFGTTMSFYQPTAPFGWVQLTSSEFEDAAIRIVNTFGGGYGGQEFFSSVFTTYTPSGDIDISQLRTGNAPVSGSIDSTALNTGQIAGHQHLFGGEKRFQYQILVPSPTGAITGFDRNAWSNTGNTDAAGGGQGHSHGFSLTATGGSVTGSAAFTGTPKSFAVKYVDFIVARAS